MTDLKPIVEAILFASDAPLSLKDICRILEETDASMDAAESEVSEASDPVQESQAKQYWQAGEIKGILDDMLVANTEASERGFYLTEVAGGYQFRSKPAYAAYLRHIHKEKPYRISRSAMEVLSIVAYRQPVVRSEIDDIRGVDSSAGLRTLLERGLVRSLGHSDDVGHPTLYGTTPLFLEVFGLKDLESLPPFELPEEISPQLSLSDVDASAVESSSDENELVAEGEVRAAFDSDRANSQIERIAEEMSIDQVLIDQLESQAHRLTDVQARVLDAVFPKPPAAPVTASEETPSVDLPPQDPNSIMSTHPFIPSPLEGEG